MKMRTLNVYTGGRLVGIDADVVLGYGSLDNLMASDTLAGIPNREAIMSDLWAAANRPAPDLEAISSELTAKLNAERERAEAAVTEGEEAAHA